MPIRPENRKLYPPDWKAIVERVKARDGHACKFCGLANYSVIERAKDGAATILANATSFQNAVEWIAGQYGCDEQDVPKIVVLTTAHLDHDPTNNADENLASLCQRCHNRHDSGHRAETRFETRAAKDRAAGQGMLMEGR